MCYVLLAALIGQLYSSNDEMYPDLLAGGGSGAYDLDGECLKLDETGDPDTYLCASAADEVTLTCGSTAVWVCNASGCDLAGELGSVTSLDATTEATIEGAIDTLANLTSVQGNALTVSGTSDINQDLTTDATVLFGGINIGGTTSTDVLIKSESDLIRLRRGDDSAGKTVECGALRAQGYVRADAASYIEFNGRGRFYSPTDGKISVSHSSGSPLTILQGGTGPVVLSACGTTPTVAGTDMAGKITVGGGGAVTSCTATFASAYSSAPACTISGDNTAVTYATTTSTTALTITSSTDMQSDVISYICMGY